MCRHIIGLPRDPRSSNLIENSGWRLVIDPLFHAKYAEHASSWHPDSQPLLGTMLRRRVEEPYNMTRKEREEKEEEEEERRLTPPQPSTADASSWQY
jgi:hypothetical protein